MIWWWVGFGAGVWLVVARVVGGVIGGIVGAQDPDLVRLAEWDTWAEFDRVTAEKGTCW